MTLVSEGGYLWGSAGRERQTTLGVVDDGNFWRLRKLQRCSDTASNIMWRYVTHGRLVTGCKM